MNSEKYRILRAQITAQIFAISLVQKDEFEYDLEIVECMMEAEQILEANGLKDDKEDIGKI